MRIPYGFDCYAFSPFEVKYQKRGTKELSSAGIALHPTTARTNNTGSSKLDADKSKNSPVHNSNSIDDSLAVQPYVRFTRKNEDYTENQIEWLAAAGRISRSEVGTKNKKLFCGIKIQIGTAVVTNFLHTGLQYRRPVPGYSKLINKTWTGIVSGLTNDVNSEKSYDIAFGNFLAYAEEFPYLKFGPFFAVESKLVILTGSARSIQAATFGTNIDAPVWISVLSLILVLSLLASFRVNSKWKHAQTNFNKSHVFNHHAYNYSSSNTCSNNIDNNSNKETYNQRQLDKCKMTGRRLEFVENLNCESNNKLCYKQQQHAMMENNNTKASRHYYYGRYDDDDGDDDDYYYYHGDASKQLKYLEEQLNKQRNLLSTFQSYVFIYITMLLNKPSVEFDNVVWFKLNRSYSKRSVSHSKGGLSIQNDQRNRQHDAHVHEIGHLAKSDTSSRQASSITSKKIEHQSDDEQRLKANKELHGRLNEVKRLIKRGKKLPTTIRIISYLWSITCFLMVTIYSGEMLAVILLKTEVNVDTIAQLINSKPLIQPVIRQDDFTYNLMLDSLDINMLKLHNLTKVIPRSEVYTRSFIAQLSNRKLALLGDDELIETIYDTYHREFPLYKSKTTYLQFPISIIYRNDLNVTLERKLRKGIKQIFEMGLINQWYAAQKEAYMGFYNQKQTSSKAKNKDKVDESDKETEPNSNLSDYGYKSLSINHFKSIISFLVWCAIFSVITLAVEIIYAYLLSNRVDWSIYCEHILGIAKHNRVKNKTMVEDGNELYDNCNNGSQVVPNSACHFSRRVRSKVWQRRLRDREEVVLKLKKFRDTATKKKIEGRRRRRLGGKLCSSDGQVQQDERQLQTSQWSEQFSELTNNNS